MAFFRLELPDLFRDEASARALISRAAKCKVRKDHKERMSGRAESKKQKQREPRQTRERERERVSEREWRGNGDVQHAQEERERDLERDLEKERAERGCGEGVLRNV